jgi:GT2 family glycosyltransferase
MMQTEPRIKLIDNPKRTFPVALNLSIQNSTGDIIAVIGARAVYPADYLSQCVHYLDAYDADNVGGSLTIVPARDALMARAIALAHAHPFGAGNAAYKNGTRKIMWTDTVFGGCYKRQVFEEVGLFDERFPRSSDLDMNRRLSAAGKRTLLVPSIQVTYVHLATWLESYKRDYKGGYWIIYPWRHGRRLFGYRHLVPLAFVSSLLGLGALSIFLRRARLMLVALTATYMGVAAMASLQIARRERDLRLLSTLPAAFAASHLGYGMGSLRAVVGWIASPSSLVPNSDFQK